MLFLHDLIYVVCHERGIEDESDELEREEEGRCQEGVRYHFR